MFKTKVLLIESSGVVNVFLVELLISINSFSIFNLISISYFTFRYRIQDIFKMRSNSTKKSGSEKINHT